MDNVEEQRQYLLRTAQEIELSVKKVMDRNHILTEENARLSHELSKLIERLDSYSYELEEIRKHHADTNN